MRSQSLGGLPVFFDLDGTLAESAAGIVVSIEHALAACDLGGRTIDWRQRIGPPLQRMLESALPDVSLPHRNAVVAAYRSHYAATGIFLTTLFPGVAEAVSALVDSGAVVYVVTNKPQQPAEMIVRHLKLEHLVRRVVGGDSSGHGTKPDRAASLVAEEGITGGVFVGDSLDDLHAAERIGAAFFMAGWGYGTARVLAERPDVTVVTQPLELPVSIADTRRRC